MSGDQAAQQIDAMLEGLGDWRADKLRHVRALFHAAVPDLVETWKWMGSPVWESGGILAVGNAHKAKVKLTFPRGTDRGRYRRAMPVELPELVVPDAAGLRAWLERHGASSPGVWLALTRKGGTTTSLTWQQAVDEALCFGWIDGQGRKRDESTSCVRYTPRRPRSIWSARNVVNVARLEAAGRMTEAGRAAVQAAQADGRWDRAYAAPSEAVVPADLVAAIAAVPAAQAMFDVLTRTNRYALIHRLSSVKRTETRQRRLEQFVAMLARHEAPSPQKRTPP